MAKLGTRSGGPLTCGGYFTMLRYLVGQNGPELERRLGFHAGRLGPGYAVVVLAPHEDLAVADFELAASTRWSGGKVRDPRKKAPGREIEDLLADRHADVAALKRRVAWYFNQGAEYTPAKVLPAWRHASGMEYPDGEVPDPAGAGKWMRGGVPQFRLTRPRSFTVLANFGPA